MLGLLGAAGGVLVLVVVPLSLGFSHPSNTKAIKPSSSTILIFIFIVSFSLVAESGAT